MKTSSKNVVPSSSLMAKVAIAGAVLTALGLTASAVTASNIIYQDFTGAGNPSSTIGTLNGKTPVIDNYTGSPTWSAGGAWADSGYSNNSANINGTGPQNISAYLPFVPTAGNVYTLSAVMDPYITSASSGYGTSQSNEWLGIGFLPSTYSSDSGNLNNTNTVGFNSTTPTGASPWMVARSSAGTVIGHVHETDGYGGVGATNGQVYNPPTIGAPLTETIVLNTQAAAWTTTFFVNGVNIGSTYTFSSGNPSIAYVGMENAVIDGTISDFTLSTPEPASLGLLGLGGVAGLLLLKRRRIA